MNLLLLLSVSFMSFFLSLQSSSSFRQLRFLPEKDKFKKRANYIDITVRKQSSQDKIDVVTLQSHNINFGLKWLILAPCINMQAYVKMWNKLNQSLYMYRSSFWNSWSSRVNAVWIIVIACSRTALKSLWANTCSRKYKMICFSILTWASTQPIISQEKKWSCYH